jgi:circadian clock protein KaiC
MDAFFETDKAATGVAGLDDIMGGGLATGRVFLLEGHPGTGKTTIALRFLMEGAAQGERSLYVTLSETESELRVGAASHGWTLDPAIKVFEVVPPELLDAAQQQSLLYSSDLELGETTKMILEEVARYKPARLVLDSLSEIRLLSQSSLRYRRQILAMKHFFSRHGATVLMLDDLTTDVLDKTVHSVAHGVIRLEEFTPKYGTSRRRVRVVKYRGQPFRSGYHDSAIRTGGVEVYPRLVASEHHTGFERIRHTTGITELDALLGGGIEQGSSTLVIGPSGTGKSVFTLQFVSAAMRRGEKAAMFIFDEELGLLFDRAKALGFDLEAWRNAGQLIIQQLDAAELSPGEFAYRVREQVDRLKAKTVVIDSMNGYQAAMPDESALPLHIHELIQYLNRQGATTFLTVAQAGVVGDIRAPVDLTYLADTAVLLRYFEAKGKVLRAISVIKKRTGAHEETIREFHIGQNGLTLGEPLTNFQGVLSGVPEFVSDSTSMLSGSK